jgi:poly(beta-D-mannuronate) lyase
MGPLVVLAIGLLAAAAPPDETPTPRPTPDGVLHVSSVADLQARIDEAAAGQHIVLANGTYTTTAEIEVKGRHGTPLAPIVIEAESVGGATLGGTSGFAFHDSSYVTVRGFRFTHAKTQDLASDSPHLRLTRNVFELAPSVVHWVTVSGDDDEVDHNTFQNKKTQGVYLAVRGPGSPEIAQRPWFHHNYFLNHSFAGANGGEGIQIGLSHLSLSSAHARVEYNLFEEHNGDPEAISVKSSDNVVRYNTVRHSRGCLVLRHGNRTTLSGNFVLDSRCGIRFYGNDHEIEGNYVAGTTADPAITFGSGSVLDHLAEHTPAERRGQDASERVRVASNLLVDNVRHISGEEVRKYAPRDCEVVNNVLVGDKGTFVRFEDETVTGFRWEGNVLWGRAESGDIPASGFKRADPGLLSTDGIYRLPGARVRLPLTVKDVGPDAP